MAIFEHTGSRADRTKTVQDIAEDEWNLDILTDLFLGLHDHAPPVYFSSRLKLLKMACNPAISPFSVHPRDVAYLYIRPSTVDETQHLIKAMKELGPPAEKICKRFFEELRRDHPGWARHCLTFLEGSPLHAVAKTAVEA